MVTEGARAFRVTGRGVELLVERHDLGNEEALSYLEQRLTEIGVVAALRSAGFEPGDEVRIGEHEFELHRAEGQFSFSERKSAERRRMRAAAAGAASFLDWGAHDPGRQARLLDRRR